MIPKLKRVCNTCGDTGKDYLERTPCPKCGKVYADVKITREMLIHNKIERKYIDVLESRDKFSIDSVRRYFGRLTTTQAYQDIEKEINAMLETVMYGDTLNNSYVININDELVLDSLSETLLRITHNSGKKIFPYTRVNVLFDLKLDANKFTEYPNYAEYTFKDVLTADLLCVKIHQSQYRLINFLNVLNDVIAMRADFDKPTVILLYGDAKKLFNKEDCMNHPQLAYFKSKIKTKTTLRRKFADLLYIGGADLK